MAEKGIWDIGKACPKDIHKDKPFNLIVASNAIHTSNGLNLAIANARDALIEGGYLLLYEWTNIQTALCWGLDTQCWTHDRSEGLFLLFVLF